MSRRLVGAAIAAVVSLAVAVPAQAGSSGINAYRVKATAKNLEKLAHGRLRRDRGSPRSAARSRSTAPRSQIARLSEKSKVRAKLVRDRKGRTSAQRSRTKVRRGLAKLGLRSLKQAGDPTAGASDAAYQVYRKYDAVAGDGHEQYTELYDRILSTYPGIAAKRVIGQTEWGRDIIAIQVTQEPDRRRQRQAGRALQRAAARARVARGRDLQAHAELLHEPVRQGPAGHAARGLAPALVRLRVESGRLRVHVHRGQPPVAQEPPRQRRRRPDHEHRRRRPEPQLPDGLGPGRRGLVAGLRVGDLSRTFRGVRAGDRRR